MGVGVFLTDYQCAYTESGPPAPPAPAPAPPPMPSQVANTHGSSLFRKKNRLTAGRDVAASTPHADAASSSLSPPERPATSSAHSRRGSRGSSITSLNELKNPAFRRRSTSLRKNPAAALSSDMLAPTTSREARSVLPLLCTSLAHHSLLTPP